MQALKITISDNYSLKKRAKKLFEKILIALSVVVKKVLLGEKESY